MIYKIDGNFDEGLEEKLDKLSSKYTFLIISGVIFVCQKKFDDSIDLSELFDSDSFYIEEITPENLKYESQTVIEWCRDNFVRLDIQRFEKNEQAKLQDMWSRLNQFEADMELKLEEKRKEV